MGAGEKKIVNRGAFYALPVIHNAAQVAVGADSPPFGRERVVGVAWNGFWFEGGLTG